MEDAGAQSRSSKDVETERKLLKRARDGDAEARDILGVLCNDELEAYLARISGAKLRRVHTPADLAQEVFLRAFRVMDALREDAVLDDFRQVLRRNARWVVMTRGARLRDPVGESAVGMPLEDAVPNREAGETTGPVTYHDEQSWLYREVKRLDSKYVEVVHPRLLGEEFMEIARRLGISEDVARKRFQRGCALLRERLGQRAP